MQKRLSASIIIPNWNGVELLRKNLPQVMTSSRGAEIIVVDDASSDDSVSLLRQKFPQVKLVSKNTHQGFASTVNTGVEAAGSEIVVLLNSDVVPERGFLSPLLSHFQNVEVFAVGCLDQSQEGDSVILRGRGLASWKKGFFIHWRGEVNKRDTMWVSGGSGAFRREVWLKLGGMDVIYNPFYWEDIDLSYRALKAGYKLRFEPQSRVWHYHDEGKIKKEFSSNLVKLIAYRNQFIFIWKNLSDLSLFLQHIFWTPIKLTRALFRGEFLMWVGYLAAVIRLPQILVKRLTAAKMWCKTDRELVTL